MAVGFFQVVNHGIDPAQVRPSTGTPDQKESYQITRPRMAGLWRAGGHTDFDCLTLLFQRAGQGGLEVCAGPLGTYPPISAGDYLRQRVAAHFQAAGGAPGAPR